MKEVIDSFDISIQRVNVLDGLYTALDSLTTRAIDASDILRSEIVFTVSALDYLIHEMTICGILQIFDGIRPRTTAYEKLQIPIGNFFIATDINLNRNSLEEIIRERYSYFTFQRPNKISEAIRLFSSIELWNTVGRLMQKDKEQLKNELNLIVDRRNKIAHESDMDPSYPQTRWPISKKDTYYTVEFVNKLGHAIYDACGAL